ncbi:formate/nitrite transporter family protein [Intestinibacillus massiliensis]|uniref:formate/nitrite transporter family protein n=1 Tax=Intestinibacillus massiliensis TaxID=1871029 RepID=UPI000B35F229|nr:formate/nitrite transporter family protein [Intestinibacillus massiliensis]
MLFVRQLVSAWLSGILVGIGGTALFSTDQPFIGSFLFTFGLFFILMYRLHLYTGKVGYLLGSKRAFMLEVLVTWVGNWLGTFAVARLIRLTRLTGVVARAQELVGVKMADSACSLLVLAFFCGMLMYLAVHTYRVAPNAAMQVFAIFLPVLVFAGIGFEHCIANMYFFSLAGAWTAKKWAYLLLITLGNTLGGLFLPVMRKFILKELD